MQHKHLEREVASLVPQTLHIHTFKYEPDKEDYEEFIETIKEMLPGHDIALIGKNTAEVRYFESA